MEKVLPKDGGGGRRSKGEPLLAIIVPVFNEDPDLLRQSLGSIVDQSFSDFECLIVDESSDARSSEYCLGVCAQDQRFKYVRPKVRLGLVGSLNAGVASSTAPLIARFDADDVCVRNRFELQVKFMQDNPEIGVLGGGLQLTGEGFSVDSIRRYPLEHSDIEKAFNFTTPIAHPSVIVRRTCLERVGGYSEKYRYAEDLDLWLRMLRVGVKFANLPNVLVKYRVRGLARRKMHWIYNLRARLSNFCLKNFWRRSLGILIIAVVLVVPDAVVRFFVRGLIVGSG